MGGSDPLGQIAKGGNMATTKKQVRKIAKKAEKKSAARTTKKAAKAG